MPIDISRAKSESDGKWHSILRSFGITVSENPSDHTACPLCGPGNNSHRFRFDNKDGRGTWICNSCGSGDGILLVMKKNGWDFVTAMKEIGAVVGNCEKDAVQCERPSTDNRKNNIALWKSSIPLNGSTPVDKYLRSRKILFGSNAIRYCPKCYNAELGKEIPAMVAAVQNPDGKAVSIHRTYLTMDGEKANVEKVKMLTPVSEKISGGAIRLFKFKDILGVCEGIETAFSCMQLFDIPTWPTISSTVLEGFVPPEKARHIIIYGDADANFVGQKAAYTLANRLYNMDRIVDVLFPDEIGTDFNDILKKG